MSLSLSRTVCAVAVTAALVGSVLAPAGRLAAQGDQTSGPDDGVLRPIDVFGLEYAADPQISPDGESVVYVRRWMDVMTDRARSTLWVVAYDGSDHRPLTTGSDNAFSPRWSPTGDRLLYVSTADDGAQIWMRWMDTGQTARLTQLTRSPGSVAWSRDGRSIAFTMFVPERPGSFASMPAKPAGAEWAEPSVVIDSTLYRADGAGYLEDGFTQVFVLPVEGGTPRQLTWEPFDHRGPLVWSVDGASILLTANDDREADPSDTDIYEVSLEDGSLRALTDRQGPDGSPSISPDGSTIAYVGYDDRYQGYQLRRLYLMDRDGGDVRELATDFDRSVGGPVFTADGTGILFGFSDRGNGKIGRVPADGGEVMVVDANVGGTSLGRPYGGGSFSLSPGGRYAFTHSRPDHPADVAVGRMGGMGSRLITQLNRDLLGHKELAAVQEMWWESSFDGRRVHGWIATPPDFDADKKYPLILEIHGGPFADYGDRFAAEIQLYAAAGYVVLYSNPRGSTSYGEEFGNLIHHAYPGNDYDDLMSGVDAVIARGYIDEDNLFVTGGSGGGVLSSWIVGKTDRFAGAVVAKPVINWTSFVLTADSYTFFYRYWFPGFPWDHPQHYWERSPLSLVGNVTTPTMLMTGEEDYRTPISESEQYYQALRLRGVDSALVRIPGASHGITARPSNLIAKAVYILEWFERHRTDR